MTRAFAGPLCRYFAGERGEPATLIAGVEAWRQGLQRALAGRLQQPLDWNETPEAAWSVQDAGDAGFAALRLFAFYAERSELELPDRVPALLELDARWREASDAKFATSAYGHLLACRAWLPVELGFTFRAPLPDGEFAEIGSVPVLCDQLRWLNQRTFQAGEDAIARWLHEPAPAGGDLLTVARRGFAASWLAAGAALRQGSPLVVDAGA